MSVDYEAWARRVVAAAEAARQRRAVVLAGGRAWGVAVAARMARAVAGALWIADEAPAGVWALSPARARAALGREIDALVFDAHDGFDPDAFGATVGAIRGGGLLVLLAPPLEGWARAGRFERRLVDVLRAGDAFVVEEGRPPPAVPPAARAPETPPAGDPDCATPDQAAAVAALVRVGTGRRRRPVVLTSDRGRGKSAALGIAAARLLLDAPRRIVVTAPGPDAVRPLFAHARRVLGQAPAARPTVRYREGRLDFVPPGELLAGATPAADVLFVDEAAALPVPLLERLLRACPRVAFATTIHGYEGTGRGFAVRFRGVLDARAPGWRAVTLETPVRYAPGDPVERLSFRALLLDAAPVPDEAAAGATVESCRVERVDRDALAGDERDLSALAGLLVLAHYRTTPGDLRRLLDDPGLAVYALRHAGHVVGAALVETEAGADAATRAAIYEGRRRPRRQMLAEALSAHLGLEEAPALRGGRVMRIAVHPAAQGRGLGRRLIAAVTEDARRAGRDYLGSSFGATAPLLRFWSGAGLPPVRLGVARGAASGERSALVLRGLSPAGERLAAAARARFVRHLPHMLPDTLRDLEPEVVVVLLAGLGPLPSALDAADRRDLAACAFGRRDPAVVAGPVHDLVFEALSAPDAADRLDPGQRAVLVARVLQKRPDAEVAAALGLAGRPGVLRALRAALRLLVRRRAPEEVARFTRRGAASDDAPRS